MLLLPRAIKYQISLDSLLPAILIIANVVVTGDTLITVVMESMKIQNKA
jgi:hypothetical protein